MTGSELMGEGINLMLAGMGFVLTFLLILIYAIGLMSKLVNKYFPEPIPEAKPSSPIPLAANSNDNDLERLRPAIVAAIAHHRRQQGLK